MAESLLTASDVAQLLKLNVETVYALIATKGLPAAKIGGQWRFEASRVQAWVRTCYGAQERGIDTPPPAPQETALWTATTSQRVVQETAQNGVGINQPREGAGYTGAEGR